MVKQPKILIGIPCGRDTAYQFTKSLFLLDTPGPRNAIFVSGSMVDVAREKIARYAVDKKYDYVLFVDSDMSFEPDALTKLLACNKSIVCGWYGMREEDGTVCVWKSAAPDENGELQIIPDDNNKGLHEVAACGFGMVLIKTKVFADIFERFGTCFAHSVDIGEDIMFCLRARNKDLGYKVWCAPHVKLGHVGIKEYRY